MQDIARHCKALQIVSGQFRALQHITLHGNPLESQWNIDRNYLESFMVLLQVIPRMQGVRHCRTFKGIAMHGSTLQGIVGPLALWSLNGTLSNLREIL